MHVTVGVREGDVRGWPMGRVVRPRSVPTHLELVLEQRVREGVCLIKGGRAR